MNISLAGKVALITGGARGIGHSIALELAENGADIAIIDMCGEEAGKASLADIAEKGVKTAFYRLDVTDFKAGEEVTRQVIADMGGVDILVNNAGITRDNLIMSMSEEDFELVLDVNLKGTFNMIRHFYRSFARRKSGRIINISSIAGMMGNIGQANYSASKAGVIGLTKTTARELASRGITCNAIAPGFIRTDMTDKMTEEAREKGLEAVPMRRIGTPEDIANTAAFLASDAAGYITGEVVRIDGGMYI